MIIVWLSDDTILKSDTIIKLCQNWLCNNILTLQFILVLRISLMVFQRQQWQGWYSKQELCLQRSGCRHYLYSEGEHPYHHQWLHHHRHHHRHHHHHHHQGDPGLKRPGHCSGSKEIESLAKGGTAGITWWLMMMVLMVIWWWWWCWFSSNNILFWSWRIENGKLALLKSQWDTFESCLLTYYTCM